MKLGMILLITLSAIVYAIIAIGYNNGLAQNTNMVAVGTITIIMTILGIGYLYLKSE